MHGIGHIPVHPAGSRALHGEGNREVESFMHEVNKQDMLKSWLSHLRNISAILALLDDAQLL